jgi:antitoxin component HigA of HigAB toxin-antitoxin module
MREDAPRTISSREPAWSLYFPLLDLQRKPHRTESETAKLLVVLIADDEAKHLTIAKASGVEVLKELMDANGLRQKDLAEDLGGEGICVPDPERRAPTSETIRAKSASRLRGFRTT